MYKWKWDVDDTTVVELKCSMFGKETILVNNQEILSKRNLIKFTSEEKFLLSGSREAIVLIQTKGSRPDATLHVDGKFYLAANPKFKKICEGCKSEGKMNDTFCRSCGTEFPKAEVIEKQMKVKEATKTIQTLAVMFSLFGIILFFMNKGMYDASLAKLAAYQSTDTFPTPINGVTYVVSDLYTKIQVEKYSILALNIFLALIMLGLSFWAKKAPLPALLVATAIYVAIQVLNAVVAPETIAQGIIVKIIVIVMLVKGIKSALQLKPIRA